MIGGEGARVPVDEGAGIVITSITLVFTEEAWLLLTLAITSYRM